MNHIDTTTTLSHLALTSCRGLSFSEAACFAGLLLSSQQPLNAARHISGPSSRNILAAVSRVMPLVRHGSSHPLGLLISQRLSSDPGFALSLVHPSWSHQSPSLLPDAPQHTSFAPFDPRHRFEAQTARVLEPFTLRTLPLQHLMSLIRHLGLAATASIALADDNGREHITTLVRKLGLTIGAQMLAAIKRAPPFPISSTRPVITLQRRHHHILENIDETGLTILACAASIAGTCLLRGLSLALPNAFSQHLLLLKPLKPSLRQAAAPLSRWVLESLQYLSLTGDIDTPFHLRDIILQPPGTTLSLLEA